MTPFDELKYKYGTELKDNIIGAFKGYGINLEWKSGWGFYNHPDPVMVESENFNDIEIFLITKLEDFEGLEKYDYIPLERFVNDVVNNFINNHLDIKPYDKLEVKPGPINVGEIWRPGYGQDQSAIKWLEVFVQLHVKPIK